MQKVHPVQTNFSAGELSPWLLGRNDIERYFAGAEIIENYIVRHQGPVVRRMGTRKIKPTNPAYVCEQDMAKTVRLLDFVFSRKDALTLEISAGKFRFIYRGAYLELDGVPYSVTTQYGTAIPVPYLDNEVNDIQVTQSADVLFITHPNHPPATLSRHSLQILDWRYEIMPLKNGPYMDKRKEDEDISLTVYGIDDRMTVTSTQAEFGALAVGDYIQYCDTGAWVVAKILYKVSNSSLVVQPYEDFCLQLDKSLYCVGNYTGWDSGNGMPGLASLGPVPAGTNYGLFGVTINACFSATAVITSEHMGKFLRFTESEGTIHWMLVSAGDNILQQGAYGILAKGQRLNAYLPTGYITKSARTVSARIKSSAPSFSVTNDIGRMYRLIMNATVIHATMVADAANTSSDIKVTINRSLPVTASDARKGTFYITSATSDSWQRGSFFIGNYPTTVTIHEERLSFGGTYVQPQTGWMSKSGDIYNFASTEEDLSVTDESAIVFTIASDTVNQILWMVSRGVLLVGTVATEHKITAGASAGVALTATNATASLQTSYGSEAIKPVALGKAVLFTQQSGIKLRQMGYDFSTDTYSSLDLTEFAEHILKVNGGAKQFSYQLTPESMVYIRLGNGQVAAFTYESDQQVYAWSRFVIGGDSAQVESLACVPEDTYRTGFYRLYLVVKRKINGAWVRSIEVMEPAFQPESDTDWSEFYFMDGMVEHSYSSSDVAPSVTLTEFAGETVHITYRDVNANGAPIIKVDTMDVPESGVISLTSPNPSGAPARTIRAFIGHPYVSILKTFPVDTNGLAGTSQGKIKRTDHYVVRLIDSLDFKHGRSLAALRSETTPRDRTLTLPNLYSGDFRLPVDNGFDTRAAYYFVQDKPYPLSILSLMPEVAQYQ